MNSAPFFERFTTPRRRPLSPVRPLTVFVLAVLLVNLCSLVPPLQASLEQGGFGGQVLFGRDDDTIANPAIQPIPPPPDQSLSNTDVLVGGFGNDVLIGLLGSDVLRGGPAMISWSAALRAACRTAISSSATPETTSISDGLAMAAMPSSAGRGSMPWCLATSTGTKTMFPR